MNYNCRSYKTVDLYLKLPCTSKTESARFRSSGSKSCCSSWTKHCNMNLIQDYMKYKQNKMPGTWTLFLVCNCTSSFSTKKLFWNVIFDFEIKIFVYYFAMHRTRPSTEPPTKKGNRKNQFEASTIYFKEENTNRKLIPFLSLKKLWTNIAL